MSGKKAGYPGKAARFAAAVLALVLTGTLFMTALGFLGAHWLTSQSLHERIATDGQVIGEQMKRIGDEVKLLAEEYGFSKETVMHEISEEALKEADLKASRWLTDALREGKLGEVDGFNAATVEEALQADEAFVSGQDPFMLKNTEQQIRSRIEAFVTEQTLTFREILLRAAEKTAGQTVHLPTLATLLRQIPLLLLLASAVIAGFIALSVSRALKGCLRYIGSAVTACGILLLIGLALFYLLDIGNVMKEISVSAARKYELLAVRIGAETGVTALLLTIGGLVCTGVGRSALK